MAPKITIALTPSNKDRTMMARTRVTIRRGH
jgi:hypothetical protein